MGHGPVRSRGRLEEGAGPCQQQPSRATEGSHWAEAEVTQARALERSTRGAGARHPVSLEAGEAGAGSGSGRRGATASRWSGGEEALGVRRTTPASSTTTAEGRTRWARGQGGGLATRDLRCRARRARADPAGGAARGSPDEAGRRRRWHGAWASSCSFLGRRERGHRERERENRRKRGAGRGRSWGRGRRLARSPGRRGDEGLMLLDERTLGKEVQAAGMEPRRRSACSDEIQEEAEEASGAASDPS